ncbi:MAG: sigma E protease regulator RseP [Pseudomonadales bacterium]
MDLLQTIFATIVTLGLLVTVHEYGHFWVARRCGVKVLRFSIGFGKPLYTRKDRHGTEFVVAAIPLGGYVKMLDEREGEVAEAELAQAFNRKSVGQRIAIVVAGPAANFLFAIFAYGLMFMTGVTSLAPVIGGVTADSLAAKAGLQAQHEIIAVDGVDTPSWQKVSMQLLNHIGDSDAIELQVRTFGGETEQDLSIPLQNWLVDTEVPDVLGGLGVQPYRPEIPARVKQVVVGSAAERAKLQTQDLIVAADGKAINVWGELVGFIQARPGEKVTFEIERNGARLFQTVILETHEDAEGKITGRVGIAVETPEWPEEMRRDSSYSLPGAFVAASQQTWDMTVLILVSMKKMLLGMISIKNLSGPITIAQVAGDSVQQGLETFLSFLAYLSISLGVINILPIPLLDGGHLMYYLAELVRGKPVSEKIQMLGLRFGIGIIMTLMIFALYNDLTRLL